jgi:CRP/FNR family transcriptional regulator
MYARTIVVPHDHATGRPCHVTLPVSQQLRSLFAYQPIEHHDADTVLFWEGDAAAHVFEVVEGVLRIVKSLSGGRRVVIGFCYPGEVLGALLKNPHLHSAEAITHVSVRRRDRVSFETELNRRPELGPVLIATLCTEMEAAQGQMVLLARKTAEERVCTFLLQQARRLRGMRTTGPIIEIAMPRLDIADYLGLTQETVSRVIARLTMLGVISVAGRRTIVIRTFEHLETHAGDGCEVESFASQMA